MFLNLIYYSFIFIFAFVISLHALVRRINNYNAGKTPLYLSVDKEDVVISNSVAGRVEEVSAVTGEHVQSGSVLLRIVDDSLSKRIESLSNLSEDNISARTELETLRSKIDEYEIKAPRSGVVYRVTAAGGSYLGASSPLVTLFADDNVKVVGTVNQEQYAEIQKSRELNVYNERFGQVYKITFEGVGRVQPATNYEGSKYEVQFRFSDLSEGAAFIEGERLEVISKSRDEDAIKPSFRIANVWNRLFQ